MILGEPVSSPERRRLVERVAGAVSERTPAAPMLAAIDGVDGAGKTRFADELASAVETLGRPVIRASVDSFHQPRAVRHRAGPGSPEGFYRDSYDYAALRRVLLDPLLPGGSRRVRRAVFDHVSDAVVDAPEETAAEDAVLLFDGLFLHRPELRGLWTYSVWLEVDFEVSVPRWTARDGGDPDPEAASNLRYVEGQRLYLADAHPWRHADLVVDNNDLAQPFVIERR